MITRTNPFARVSWLLVALALLSSGPAMAGDRDGFRLPSYLWHRDHRGGHHRPGGGVPADIEELSARLSDLEDRNAALEEQNAAQAAQISALEGGVTALSGRADTLSGDLAGLEARVVPLESLGADIAGLAGRVGTAEGALAALGARVTPLEGLGGNVADLYGRTDALAGDLTTLSARIDEVGGITAQVVLDQARGPLPLGGAIETHGGTLIVLASGTGWHTGGFIIGMNIEMDGVVVGSGNTFANESFSHKAYPATYLVLPNVPAGLHSFALSNQAGATITDSNDRFSLLVIEVPNP